jgi:5'-AMP-activated protein kinase regulatory beta subunit
VQVAGDFTEWQRAPLSLKKQRDGLWKGSVSLAPGTYEYRLLVDGEWTDDPQCMNRRPNEFGSQNCICVVEAPQARKEAAGAEPAVQNA